MPTYTCSDCGKNFNHRNDFMKHSNRKFSCKKDNNETQKEINPDINIRDSINLFQNLQDYENSINSIQEHQIMCHYCLKIYSDKYILYRHMKLYCKVKKQDDDNKEEIYQKLLRENEELKKENEKLKKSAKIINNTKKITNNIHNGDINNGNINNIVIIPHGREDLDKIDIKYILEALKRGLLKELVSLKRD